MPTFKSAIAGLALATAATGGVVTVGALTTASSAGATTVTSTSGDFSMGCWRRWGCGFRGGWGGRRGHQRVKIHIHIHNNNVNNNDNDADADAVAVSRHGEDDD
ncbi:hypothetical protein MTP10_28840 [Nonomuraea sp. 3-1Str]|uniref:hypothetical protein n=1 Tax=Nonomuraea sp. 3-1Str TaxID=2929801 RepID=UPI002862AA2B|nr:hypothetical protein [Nonomuraea sp. 3-1Str]MDR8412726.1 hypothetical protein [Nonomuraea sp. 3-1Str]